MPFIPHTEDEIKSMLDVIGVNNVAELFDEIPSDLITSATVNLPEGITEMELNRLVNDKTAQLNQGLCFIGAGAYEHHIPAAVWDITSRGEFLTAYTPYQAEASQGTLQLLFEYQSMMASLTGMRVSNASLYDGASALAEAVLMAIRINHKKQSNRILVAGTLHPHYLQTLHTIVSNQNIEIIRLPFDAKSGIITLTALENYTSQEIIALVVPQPNFFGCLESVDLMTDWAHDNGALVVACVNPTSLGLLKEPGKWGSKGADIVCGEGQPLGIPLAAGGPYCGFLCCRQEHVRQMPGRIIGKTADVEGNVGYTLTLQAREQHIRRAKATSNICTNQGLLVTASSIYLSLLGPHGLAQVAKHCHLNTTKLYEKLSTIKGVTRVFNSPFFHEAVIKVKQDATQVLEDLHAAGIAGGIALDKYYPELENCILFCVTETKSDQDLAYYAETLENILSSNKGIA